MGAVFHLTEFEMMRTQISDFVLAQSTSFTLLVRMVIGVNGFHEVGTVIDVVPNFEVRFTRIGLSLSVAQIFCIPSIESICVCGIIVDRCSNFSLCWEKLGFYLSLCQI